MSHSPPSIRHSERARYLDLFNRMLDRIFLLDVNTLQIVDANPAAELKLSLSAEKLQGRSLVEWIHLDEREKFEKMLRIARRSYYPRAFRSQWHPTAQLSEHLDVSACALQAGTGEGETIIQVILRDVTREVEAQKAADRYLADLRKVNQYLDEIARRDEMTQLANFREFMKELETEHRRCADAASEYSVVFCDVDHFKRYNDTYGHPAGDALLRELAKILTGEARGMDLAARYGGEEFVILCRATGMSGALVLAERVRAAVAAHPFRPAGVKDSVTVTLSFGVASFPACGGSPESVLQAADQALYMSKKSGRNKVSVAVPASGS